MLGSALGNRFGRTEMRMMIMSLAFVLTLGSVGPAMAQTHGSKQTEASSPAITIDLATVGGGLVGLVAATGLVNLYNAGAMMVQGTAFVEAIETGAGLPILASAVAVVVGGMYAKDMVANDILPLFGAGDTGKGGH